MGWLLAIVLLAVVAGAAVAMRMAVERAADRVAAEEALATALGTEVDVAGDVRLRLWPVPRLVVDDVVLQRPDFRIAVNRVEIDLAAVPATLGEIRPQEVRLASAGVSIADTLRPTATADLLRALENVAKDVPRGLSLKDGTVAVIHGEDVARVIASDVRATVVRDRGVLRTDARFHVEGRDIVAVGARGDAGWRLDVVALTPGAKPEAELDEDAVAARLLVEGVTADGEDDEVEGRVLFLAGRDLLGGGFEEAAGLRGSAEQSGQDLRAEGRFAVVGDRVVLERLEVETPASRMEARVTLDIGKRLGASIDGTVDRLVLPDGKIPSANAPGQVLDGLRDVRLPAVFRLLDVRLALDLETIVLGERRIRDVRLDLEASAGDVAVREVSMALPGRSSLAAHGRITLRADGTTIDGMVRGESGNLRMLLGWLDVDVQGVPVGRLRAGRAAASFAFAPGKLVMEAENVVVDETPIRLDLRVLRDSDHSIVEAEVLAGEIDLDAYGFGGPVGKPVHARLGERLRDGLRYVTHQGGDRLLLDLDVERLRVGGIDLHPVTLALVSGDGVIQVRRAVAGGLDGRLSLGGRIAALDPLTAALEFDVEAEGPEAAFDALELDGSLLRGIGNAWLSGRVRFDEGHLQALDTALGADAVSGELQAQRTTSGGVWDLTLAHPDVITLLGRTGSAEDVPEMPLDVRAAGHWRDGRVIARDLEVAIGDMAFVGRGRTDLAARVRSVGVELVTGRIIDLDPLAAAVSDRIDEDWPVRRLDLGALGRLQLDVVLEAGAVSLAGTRLDSTRLAFTAGGEGVVVDHLRGRLGGGSLDISGSLLEDGGEAMLSMRVGVEGVTLPREARTLGKVTVGGGDLDLDLTVGARGRTPASLLASATGEGAAVVSGLRAEGLRLEGLDTRLESLAPGPGLSERASEIVFEGRSVLDRVEAELAVADGMIRAEPLTVETAGRAGHGRLTADLSHGRLRGTIEFDAPDIERTVPAIVLHIGGTVGRPTLRVDPRPLLDHLLGRQLAP